MNNVGSLPQHAQAWRLLVLQAVAGESWVGALKMEWGGACHKRSICVLIGTSGCTHEFE